MKEALHDLVPVPQPNSCSVHLYAHTTPATLVSFSSLYSDQPLLPQDLCTHSSFCSINLPLAPSFHVGLSCDKTAWSKKNPSQADSSCSPWGRPGGLVRHFAHIEPVIMKQFGVSG